MKTLKMSLANLQGKMSRKEMKNIMAGSIYGQNFRCNCSGGSNPPFLSSWSERYYSGQDIVDALSRSCIDGAGSCYAV